MNRISADNLYPMMVTPLNFQKGDVVKKVITDNVQSPYVGIVTAVIPSTNKVEVQWPQSTAIEDPWDLIKVNPIINPPVVKEDRSYNTYQNSKKTQSYIDGLRHYNVLRDFLHEEMGPIILHAADLYNSGHSKKEAFKVISSKFDNKELVENVIAKVFNDSIEIKRATDVLVEGEMKSASLDFVGNSDFGYKISYALGEDQQEHFFESYKKAAEHFLKLQGILQSLDSSSDEISLVASLKGKTNGASEE